ncbi:hypothetical protein ACH4E8_26775 [Streptomyces sp. NPDC017979]|uniref:hypothetical protein n=1 Tax=Streptomyces sp. NPDC017979 TaxID=3365024 RepID=UPI0037A63637
MTTSSSPRTPRAILRIHFHPPDRSEGLYEHLLAVLCGISSRIEPRSEDFSAYANLSEALRFFDRDVTGVVDMIRLRLLALPASAGAAPVSRLHGRRGHPARQRHHHQRRSVRDRCLPPPRPTVALPGIGPATARTLTRYAIRTVGDIDDTPLTTLQRIASSGSPQPAKHSNAPTAWTTGRWCGTGP